MKLAEEQQDFAFNVSNLIKKIFDSGFSCTINEVYRPPETAELYEKQGRGIKNSLHTDKLAIDLNLFDANGRFLTDGGSYATFGRYWETLNPLNKWGGNFKANKGDPTKSIVGDYNHFEMRKAQKA